MEIGLRPDGTFNCRSPFAWAKISRSPISIPRVKISALCNWWSRDSYKEYIDLVGKQVTATGTLFGEHTGHHHTPVLLTVRQLAEAKR